MRIVLYFCKSLLKFDLIEDSCSAQCFATSQATQPLGNPTVHSSCKTKN